MKRKSFSYTFVTCFSERGGIIGTYFIGSEGMDAPV